MAIRAVFRSKCRRAGLRAVCWRKAAGLVLFVAVWSQCVVVLGQVEPGEKDYRFRAGDAVHLSVPARPSLNGDLVIGKDGAVVLPLIGPVHVADLTLEEMHGRIYEALRDLYPSLQETDVSLEPVLSYVVYVTGAVMKPGRYAFSGPPRVWEAIRKAEGPTGEAVLDMVRIASAESDTSQSRIVDVLKALETGTVDQLPVLPKESTVVVPSFREAYVGSLGVNVIGAVMKPGYYRLQSEHRDVMSAVLLAGGASPRASLDNVKIFRAGKDGNVLEQSVNLNDYLKSGDPRSNPHLQAGDTVSVPEQSGVAFQLKNNSLGIVIGLIGTTISILILIQNYGR